MKKFLLKSFIICILITIAAYEARIAWTNLATSFFEEDPPNISAVNAVPQGLGISPTEMTFSLSDEGAGLDEINVILVQKNIKQSILKEKLLGNKHSNITIRLDISDKHLKQGQAQLIVKVFDKSYWFNSAELKYDLVIDYEKPHITPISAQHNTVQGGSQIVFYEVKENNLTASGVKVGSQIYYGYKAENIDTAFKGKDNLYMCIYSSDLEINPKEQKPILFAKDAVGNLSTTNFYNKIAPVRYANLHVSLSDKLINTELRPLFAQEEASLDDVVNNFQVNLVKNRQAEHAKITKLLSKNSHSQKLWQEAFYKPQAIARYEYGHILNFSYRGQFLKKYRQQGFFFEIRDNDDVKALNSGVVQFIETIGSYGTIVAIDHGLGLFSLYANLASYAVNVGDKIEAGQKIGTAGTSGLAFNKGFQFELWRNNTPINPREWWDLNWYHDHVEAKIIEVKNTLGIKTSNIF